MRISVQLYGQLRHIAGEDVVVLDVPEDATLASALLVLSASYDLAFHTILFDDAGALRPALMLLINEHSIDKQAPPPLAEGDVITVLPAISGG